LSKLKAAEEDSESATAGYGSGSNEYRSETWARLRPAGTIFMMQKAPLRMILNDFFMMHSLSIIAVFLTRFT
jgi:hypothetical protein